MAKKQSAIEMFQATNPMHNSSASLARKVFGFFKDLGLEVDDIVAIPEVSNGVAHPVSIGDLQALGLAGETPLNYHLITRGKNEGDNDRFENVAQTVLNVRGQDTTNAFISIYTIRNPGVSRGEAFAKLNEVPKVQDAVREALAPLKTF